jgi:DNA primase
MGRVKYSEFVDQLDVDALMEAIGFTPEYMDNRGNHVGYCVWPEHHTNGDTTGKFAIHPEKMVYNCYVCGGGSLLSLVMELNGWDSETAENYLRQFAGDTRTDLDFVDDFLAAFARDAEKRADTMPYFNGRVLEKYLPAYEWGDTVGLKDTAIDDFCVLYAPEAVKRSPGKGKFTDVPDYVGPCVMWPHWWNKRLVGWQSRWLDDDRPDFVPKWTNTVDFPKDSTLYGYQWILPGQKLYVVESAKSVAKIRQLGFQATGTFGSSVNDAQLRLLRKFQHGVVLWKDNDKAGDEWFKRCYDYLYRYVPLEGVAPVGGLKSDVCDLSDDEAFDWIAEHTVDLTTPHM